MLLWVGCQTTSDDVSVDISTEAKKDKAYHLALQSASRQVKVYDNFETILVANTTFLSAPFRTAFSSRLSTLLDQALFSLDEGTNKSAFFVSVFTPEDEKSMIGNTKLWSIFLTNQSEKIYPSLIKELPTKERWRTFFPYVNNWSKEFLILFDIAPEYIMRNNQLVEGSGMEMVLASIDAQVKIAW